MSTLACCSNEICTQLHHRAARLCRHCTNVGWRGSTDCRKWTPRQYSLFMFCSSIQLGRLKRDSCAEHSVALMRSLAPVGPREIDSYTKLSCFLLRPLHRWLSCRLCKFRVWRHSGKAKDLGTATECLGAKIRCNILGKNFEAPRRFLQPLYPSKKKKGRTMYTAFTLARIGQL